MTLAVFPWTGNGHEVGQQFADDGLHLFVGGLAKDLGEMPFADMALEVIV
jgi:hypothetical protein